MKSDTGSSVLEEIVVGQASSWSADVALHHLYDERWVELVRLATMLTHDQGRAEEIVQDTFVAIHKKWPTLRDHNAAIGYLRTSVVNGSRSWLRRRATMRKYLERTGGQAVETAAPADQTALAAEERDTVLEALQALPRRQREVLTLRHYLDLSEKEIADLLGISPGSVKSHTSRGSAALKNSLSHLVQGGTDA